MDTTVFFVMNISIEQYRNFDNKLCNDVIDLSTGLPYSFWLTAWLQDSFAAFHTARKCAYQLKFISEYFHQENIDFIERIIDGSFFTKQELEDFFSHSLYKSENHSGYECNVVNINKLTLKTLDNLTYTKRHNLNKVGVSTVKIRVNTFSLFIQWLYEHVYASRIPPQDIEIRFKDIVARVNRFCRSLKDDNAVVKDVHEQAIPDEVYFKLLDVIKPFHPNNLWIAQAKLRNNIIVQLLNETGIRLGALCKLKISDLLTDKQPRIRITRTPNDSSDTRKMPASQKTKAHTSAISPELMEAVLLYVKTDRAKYPIANTHDFVFVSHQGKTKGMPIALQTVNYLFETLSRYLNFRVHPHLLRHKWNEIFELKAKKQGLSDQRIDDLRKFACGWSENTEMVSIYNEFRLAQAASEIMATSQNNILKGMKELSSHD